MITLECEWVKRVTVKASRLSVEERNRQPDDAMGQHFAPGLYTISMNGGKTMLIRGAKTSGLVLTHLADDGLPATKVKAVFTHNGDKYFLRAVWVAGSSSLFCGRSKAQ